MMHLSPAAATTAGSIISPGSQETTIRPAVKSSLGLMRLFGVLRLSMPSYMRGSFSPRSCISSIIWVLRAVFASILARFFSAALVHLANSSDQIGHPAATGFEQAEPEFGKKI